MLPLKTLDGSKADAGLLCKKGLREPLLFAALPSSMGNSLKHFSGQLLVK